jgi:hypothetical protein
VVRNQIISNDPYSPLGDGVKLFDILGKLLDEYLIIYRSHNLEHTIFGWSEVDVVG